MKPYRDTLLTIQSICLSKSYFESCSAPRSFMTSTFFTEIVFSYLFVIQFFIRVNDIVTHLDTFSIKSVFAQYSCERFRSC